MILKAVENPNRFKRMEFGHHYFIVAYMHLHLFFKHDKSRDEAQKKKNVQEGNSWSLCARHALRERKCSMPSVLELGHHVSLYRKSYLVYGIVSQTARTGENKGKKKKENGGKPQTTI
jgi:hypothetical protein